MPRNSVSIRIGTDGKATVIRDFDEIATAGGVSSGRLRAKWERDVSAVETAVERLAKTQQRLDAASASPAQRSIDSMSGTSARGGFRDAGGGAEQGQAAARASAMSLAAGMQQAEQEARQLLAAIDPVLAAQMRYGEQVARIDQLHAVGAVSEENYQRLLANEINLLDQVALAHSREFQQQQLGAHMAAEQAAQLEHEQAAARQLISSIDPLFAAQQRYNQQMALAFELYQSGALGASRYQQVVLGLARQVDEAAQIETLHARASGGSNIAMMELMHVVRGSADSFAAGMPPMMIFTQHLGMLAQAASYSGESMGAFGRFMGGGWGLILTAGITLLGTLIGAQLGAADASHDHETAAQTLARALAGEEDAIRKLNDAIREQRNQSEQALQTDTRRIEAAYDQARANLAVANSIRETIRAQIAQEIEAEESSNRAANDPTLAGEGGFNPGAVASALAGSQLGNLRARAAEQDAAIANANTTMRDSLIQMARSMSTAEGVVNAQFNDRQRQMETGYAHRLNSLVLSNQGRLAIAAELRTAEAQLQTQREQALQVVRDNEAAERRLAETRQTGRQVTAAEASAWIRAAGGHVSGAGRPTWIREETPGGPMSQERLWDRYQAGTGNRAARPGTGLHEYRNGANALDITGLSLGQVSEIFRQHGVHLTELLNEGDHVHGGWGPRGHGGQSHEQTLARENAARVVNTAGLLAEADAYLRSSTAGATATAQREGLTAATRQGTDTDARARQQLEQNIAQAAVTGAQHVAQLRDETAARQAVDAQVTAGTLAAGDMQQAMQDDAALRPLLVLQAQAHGAALETLTRVITAYRAALHDAHAEEAHSDALGAIGRLRADNDNARSILAINAPDEQERALQEARIRATREAADKHYSPDDATAYADQHVAQVALQQQQQAADQLRRMNAEEDDHTALLQYQLTLGRMGQQQREDAIALEQRRLQLEREFGPAHEAEIQQLLEKTRAEQQLQHEADRAAEGQRELQQAGGQVIDDILNIDNVNNWGDAWKRVLHMILQEMITLAAINPLKNLLLGENNPTLGSILGSGGKSGGGLAGILGSIFGGGSGGGGGGVMDSVLAAMKFAPGKFAAGTESAPGGLAFVAENGPELVNLPRGARVTPAAETRRLLAANDARMGYIHMPISIDATGADAAGLARVQAELASLKDELPARVVNAYHDAKSRFIIR